MEFSNDGHRDSLTGVMAPGIFYESAARLIAWARRRGEALSLISADLSQFDGDMAIQLARNLTAELRGGDLLTRLGTFNFVLMIVGDSNAAKHLIFRLENAVTPKTTYKSITLDQDEEIVKGLSRLGV